MTESTQPAQPVAHDAFLRPQEPFVKAQQDKAAGEKKHTDEAKSARDALIEKLKKPVEITEQQVASAVQKFFTAAEAGETEMVVFSSPSQLCADGGRMINNALEGWQETFVGKPRSIYEAWQRYLKDKGYRFHARVLDYPQGMLGDIGLAIVWAKKDV